MATAAPDEEETDLAGLTTVTTPVEEKHFHHISKHLDGRAYSFCFSSTAREILHHLFSVSHGSASPQAFFFPEAGEREREGEGGRETEERRERDRERKFVVEYR